MTSIHDTRPPVEATQLLVVGAGPVGLFAALCAVHRGLQVIVLEQNFRSLARGHAAILHPSSLRLLAEFGLSSRLLAEGQPIDRVDLYVEGGHEKTLDLPQSALSIPQSVVEELLLKELRAREVEIRSPCEATTLTRGPDKVQARVVRRELATLGAPPHDGEWEPVESWLVDADFVIGADGYDSQVRSALAVESLEVGPTETFAMFEGWRATPGRTLALAFQRGLGSLAYPLPGQRARWGFQLDSGFDQPADLERLRYLLAASAPWHDEAPAEVEWSAVTHFERRLARRFGTERVWLAGDSAHITSPFGGQSMNGGLSEAYELVEQMAGCLQDGKSRAGLEQRGAAREREWQKLLGFNVLYEARSNAPAWLRENARRIVPALPVSGADLQQVLAQLGVSVH